MIRRRFQCSSALVAATLIGCVPGSDPEPRGTTTAEIVGGTIDEGDPAVVQILDDGWPSCTGTVIAPRVVLTAAHCVSSSDQVFFGTSLGGPGRYVDIVREARHPEYDSGTLAHDVGFLVLAEDANVAPVPIADELGPDLVGSTGRLVGFGRTGGDHYGTSGTKRHVRVPITGFDDLTIRHDSGTANSCGGDSGGPLFVTGPDGTEVIAGVVSWGDWDCVEFGVAARVDNEDEAIADLLARVGPDGPLCGAFATLQCNHQELACVAGGADAPSPTATPHDFCGPATVTCTPSEPRHLAVGSYDFSCSATDAYGNTDTCAGSIVVADEGPSFDWRSVSAWPPNHRMRHFELSECISNVVNVCTGEDLTGRYEIMAVLSDEPDTDPAAGDTTTNDIANITATGVDLRVERQDGGDGRVYTVVFSLDNQQGWNYCELTVPPAVDVPATWGDCAACEGTGCAELGCVF